MPKWTAEQEVEALKQQLPNGAWRDGASLARCVEDIRMDRDAYRGALIGLLAVCDADPCPLADRVKRYINRTLRASLPAASEEQEPAAPISEPPGEEPR